MMPIAIAVVVFACVFAGALLGMGLRKRLPADHLSDSAKDVIRLAMGLVATMTALVLGLVIAAAKSSYDTQDDAVRHSAAKVLLLDRMLANYGPEAQGARAFLKELVANRVAAIWPEDGVSRSRLDTPEVAFATRTIETSILQLAPQNDPQRWLQSQALRIGGEISETRWLVLAQARSAIPVPFLVVVVFWLTVLFASFGLFAPRNGTVVAVLFVCALSVGAAMFLILEMDGPFEGLIRVSGAPMRYALANLGR
ncbi:MAG: hypothetical protein ACM3NZ_13530 [Betaproteobacteria bacterium]|jgi:hypothetical protein